MCDHSDKSILSSIVVRVYSLLLSCSCGYTLVLINYCSKLKIFSQCWRSTYIVRVMEFSAFITRTCTLRTIRATYTCTYERTDEHTYIPMPPALHSSAKTKNRKMALLLWNIHLLYVNVGIYIDDIANIAHKLHHHPWW